MSLVCSNWMDLATYMEFCIEINTMAPSYNLQCYEMSFYAMLWFCLLNKNPPATSECSRDKLNLIFVNILNNTCNWDFPERTFSTKTKSSGSQNPKSSVSQLSGDKLRRGCRQATERLPTVSNAKTLLWNGIAQWNRSTKRFYDIHPGCSAENDRIELRIYSWLK